MTIYEQIKDALKNKIDPNYGGEEKSAVRIGFPYGSTDRVVIKTARNTYILFTTNPALIMSKIVS